jgi:hypothetical protein
MALTKMRAIVICPPGKQKQTKPPVRRVQLQADALGVLRRLLEEEHVSRQFVPILCMMQGGSEVTSRKKLRSRARYRRMDFEGGIRSLMDLRLVDEQESGYVRTAIGEVLATLIRKRAQQGDGFDPICSRWTWAQTREDDYDFS